jgi:hypothetical protein
MYYNDTNFMSLLKNSKNIKAHGWARMETDTYTYKSH